VDRDFRFLEDVVECCSCNTVIRNRKDFVKEERSVVPFCRVVSCVQLPPRQPQLHDKTIRQVRTRVFRGGRIPRFAFGRPDCAWKKASCATINFATDHSQ
jgi:hypothetical protein